MRLSVAAVSDTAASAITFVNHNKPAVAAVVASTLVALGCGTSYAYSAWGPQFADRLKLTATQSNIIVSLVPPVPRTAATNGGMNLLGVPLGYAVDRFGPRIPMFLGAVFVGIGYALLLIAYLAEPGTYGVTSAAIFSVMAAVGGASAFYASIKISTVMWPRNRGTATAFPLAAFGLSALFFTSAANILTDGDPAGILLVLAIGAFLLVAVPAFFVPNLSDGTGYAPIAAAGSESQYRSKRVDTSPLLENSKPPSPSPDNGLKSAENYQQSNYSSIQSSLAPTPIPTPAPSAPASASTALPAGSGSVDPRSTSPPRYSLGTAGSVVDDECSATYAYHHSDISGFDLFRHLDFYLLFTLLGVLSGIGIMTIYNIGHDIKALWLHFDPSTSDSFLVSRQLIHVSIISGFSAAGRILSGVGSDWLLKFQLSRLICLTASAVILTLAQVVAYVATNPHSIKYISSLTGLGYGAVFGVFPAIVADFFGVSRLSQNWGVMVLGPVIVGSALNLVYGRVYDSNSVVDLSGTKPSDPALTCNLGRDCYRDAYLITTFGCLFCVVLSILCIYREAQTKQKIEEEEELTEAIA